jgi:hypothetical protein
MPIVHDIAITGQVICNPQADAGECFGQFSPILPRMKVTRNVVTGIGPELGLK